MSNEELHPKVPDEFEHLDNQAMWTGAYTREGKYPEQGSITLGDSSTKSSKTKPSRGHLAEPADTGAVKSEVEKELKATPMPEVREEDRQRIAAEARARFESIRDRRRRQRLDEAQR